MSTKNTKNTTKAPPSANTQALFRALPSVDALLKKLEATHAVDDVFMIGSFDLPRPMLRQLVNDYLDICRAAIAKGSIHSSVELTEQAIITPLTAFIAERGRPHFRRVINATGVVIHTNLGRSLLAEEATRAVIDACSNYSNLEFNLESGERGSRYSHVEQLLCSITGAEAALVVNNNAAAVLLVLDSLCKGREAIVSRGQLVEIGGSFRIPEVMEKSGCTLREVGATNRVRLTDYSAAINENTAALMKVHTSNYRIIGFHSEVTLAELVSLGRERSLPVYEDLGSGSLCDFAAAGVPILAHDEPTVQKVVADGADVVSFSGDKVLGGPQAGIIVGRKEYIERIKKNPLNRALRIDKMTLAALEATLRIYTDPELARKKIPTLQMICSTKEELKGRADTLCKLLAANLTAESQNSQPSNSSADFSGKPSGKSSSKSSAKVSVNGVDGAGLTHLTVAAGSSLVGGGSFPERHLETSLVQVAARDVSAKELRTMLLRTNPPVVGRIEDERFCLDVRTIKEEEFALVSAALMQALSAKQA